MWFGQKQGEYINRLILRYCKLNRSYHCKENGKRTDRLNNFVNDYEELAGSGICMFAKIGSILDQEFQAIDRMAANLHINIHD